MTKQDVTKEKKEVTMPTERVVETPDHPFVARVHVLSNDITRGAPIGRPYLSNSRITTYQRCEAQYYYKYDLKLQEPKNSGLVFGTKLHDTAEHVLNEVIKSRKEQRSIDEDHVTTTALDVATTYQLPEDLVWKPTYQGSKVDENPASFRDALVAATRMMTPYWLRRNVLSVEQGYLVEWQDETVLPLLGFSDYVELDEDGTEAIVDLKTGTAKTTMDLKLNIAMPLYAAMRELTEKTKVSRVKYDNFVRNKTPILNHLDEPVDPRAFGRVFNRARDITRRLETNVYIPEDTKMVCGTCPFFERCREEFSNPHGKYEPVDTDWQIVDEDEE